MVGATNQVFDDPERIGQECTPWWLLAAGARRCDQTWQGLEPNGAVRFQHLHWQAPPPGSIKGLQLLIIVPTSLDNILQLCREVHVKRAPNDQPKQPILTGMVSHRRQVNVAGAQGKLAQPIRRQVLDGAQDQRQLEHDAVEHHAGAACVDRRDYDINTGYGVPGR